MNSYDLKLVLLPVIFALSKESPIACHGSEPPTLYFLHSHSIRRFQTRVPDEVYNDTITRVYRKMLWGEARIIQCNLSTQKIKVHFMGWSKTYDLWTDPMSITAHGRYAPITMKGPEEKSWDGNMHLFEDMLGTIEEPNFTPIPTPAEPKSKVKLAPAPVNKNRSDKKKASIEKTKTAGPSERTAPKREAADVDVVKKAGSKRSVALAVKMKETNGQKIEQPRDRKRQKQVAAQQTSAAKPTASTTRASKKKVALPPDELPQFRELELDDGTVLDFSKQREKSRMEREMVVFVLEFLVSMLFEKLLLPLSLETGLEPALALPLVSPVQSAFFLAYTTA
ncbi:hypothetical protein JM18_004883 [Phytophthora kernoviae]|uniref:Uncharacterized protein n=1 Tax=Phytophthora kernoviae TaxID=325452 RepID=A0A8T0LWX4_9STRA|nr:hypothetical protein JM16_004968 [Phytophthora kernoviae]KAG2525514.1 hypothetical protein JM18_004883 [Phytophthora kernoviae]